MEIINPPIKINPKNEYGFSSLAEENSILRKEIQVTREAADITADLVVKQFEETEKVLHRFQVANAQRKAVLNSATQVSIIATNSEGIITVFNTGAENLLGYSAGEIIGIHSPVIFHLDTELEQMREKLDFQYGSKVHGLDIFFEFAVRGLHDTHELTYIRKDRTLFPVEMTINALRDPEGNIGGFLCIATDTTEKKRSRKALKESERKHRLLIRNLPNCVYQGYVDYSIDFFDDKIEQITGFAKEDFLSRKKNWKDLVYQDDLEYAESKFIEALKTDNTYIREYRVQAKDGNLIWIQDGGQIIYGENGEIEFIIGAFLDITERKLAEKALHESEEKYRSIFDSGPNPIFVLDRSTLVILDANPMTEETYGYDKKELTGKHFSYLGPVDELENKLVTFKQVELLKACVVSSKVQHYKKKDIPFYVKVTACPIKYKDRDAIILATTDITEMLDKEVQLLQANKMTTLGEMSAGIAHELNQPLNAIQMGSEYLKMIVENKDETPSKKMIEVSNQISDQIARATEIIKRLREFGRKPDFVRNKIDINDVIRVIYGIVSQQLLLQDIKMNIILDEGLPPILAHKTQIEQVIFNLVTNAADAINQKKEVNSSKEDSSIRVCSFCENDLVAVTVSDTGTGIPDDLKDKVFEPFFTTKEVGKGMGLGLSITYGIIKDYGGEIEIQSEKDVGTNIKLTFPATRE